MAVNPRGEKILERNGPSVIDMSISPCASWVEPKPPRSAWRLASSTIRWRSVTLKRIQRITAIKRPPANSAATNGQPRKIRRTRPSSNTRLVEANSKMIALTKLAPLRKSVRATATAAYEHEELAAPKPHARRKPLRSGLPRARATVRLETTVWMIAESKKPRASGHRTSQIMKIEICSACRTALTTNKSDLAPHQSLDRAVELADLLAPATRSDGLRDAVLLVIGQELESHAFECGPCCIDLGEDVDAVAILGDHLLDPPHLALDSSQPRLDLLLVLRIAWHPF